MFAIKTIDEFGSQINECRSVDEFDVVIQAASLEWAYSNFFISPYAKDIADPNMGWYEMISQFWDTSPEYFSKKPVFKNGMLHVNCVCIAADADGDGEGAYTFELKDYQREATAIIKDIRARISEAKLNLMPMEDFIVRNFNCISALI